MDQDNNQQNEVTEQQSVYNDAPGKKQHKLLPILITVLIMLFVTAGVAAGVWYYMDQQNKNNKLANEIKETEDLEKAIKAEEEQLASKYPILYENKEYGFTFRMPKTWENYVVSTSTDNEILKNQKANFVFTNPSTSESFVVTVSTDNLWERIDTGEVTLTNGDLLIMNDDDDLIYSGSKTYDFVFETIEISDNTKNL